MRPTSPARLRNGELTERGLARRAGISQPHLHNVLKKKKLLSFQTADTLMQELGLTIYDLLRIPPTADSGS